MHNRFRGLARLTTAAALAAGLAGGIALPAQAAQTKPFDLVTAYNGNGSARAHGSLTWHDASKLVVNGVINDRCPADGHGAYLDIVIWFMDGTQRVVPVAKDDLGCDASAGVGFSKPVDTSKRISKIRLNLTEWDEQTGDVNDWDVLGLDNPYS